MKTSTIQKIGDELLELYNSNYPILSEYQWEWEVDRWKELLVCILISQKLSPETARWLIDLLEEFQLINPETLVKKPAESRRFIQNAMARLGFTPALASKVATRLRQAAIVVDKHWAGHIQKFLRVHASRMISELSDLMQKEGFEKAEARMASTIWLQNVANLPVLSEQNKYVRKFCADQGVTPDDLINLSDHLGINLSVIDELLMFASDEDKKEKTSTASKKIKK